MKITLKRVKFYPRMSEETNAYTADVLIDGTLVGYIKNEGRGGMSFLQPIPEHRDLVRQAEERARALPPISFEGSDRTYQRHLEDLIDDLAILTAQG